MKQPTVFLSRIASALFFIMTVRSEEHTSELQSPK